MAYNNGRENRKWLIWKEAEEKILREHGVDETTTPQIILLKMQGYSTKEIAPLVHLTAGAIYARLDICGRSYGGFYSI